MNTPEIAAEPAAPKAEPTNPLRVACVTLDGTLRSLLEDWVTSFADSIEGGEADELVAATRAALAITSESATQVKGVEDAATELAKHSRTDFIRGAQLAAKTEQQIIAAFLERTGQYVTNDVSREAAIAEALAARHATLTPEQMDELAGKHGEWLGDGGIVFDREMFYGLIADVRALTGRQTAPPQSADDQTHE